jgi:hypothetical protein
MCGAAGLLDAVIFQEIPPDLKTSDIAGAAAGTFQSRAIFTAYSSESTG